jgi:hypothetical protein
MIRSAISRASVAVTATVGAATTAVSHASDLGVRAKDTALQAGSDTYGAVIETTNSILEGVIDTKNAAVDSVALFADTVGTIAKEAASTVVSAAILAGAMGLVVAAVAAPVPVGIGILVLDIMTISAAFKANPMDAVEARAIKRHNSRIIDKLAKYGSIPATSLIETPNAKFSLDMNAGNISGTIKTGFFSSKDITALSSEQLKHFSASTDEETRALVNAYLKFREAHPEALA